MKTTADGKELRSGAAVGATPPEHAFSEALERMATLCETVTQRMGTTHDSASQLQLDIPTYSGYDDPQSVANFLYKLGAYRAAIGASDADMLRRVLPLAFQGFATCWWHLQPSFESCNTSRTNKSVRFQNGSETIEKIQNQWSKITLLYWNQISSTQSFWCQVHFYKDACGENPFAELAGFAMSMLGLPYSDPEVEMRFSPLNIVKSKMRNKP
ncbi:hypothetical protein HPB48_014608 [Haemaphysalis longicornis]|uniref:Uncharacterized protein n=1 Tax=Haemaphysalis longicornis TaxID=44386 RepID=A0A9J6GN57_HAELO|nr:hypothetical protein HPB48_014608 [Haemaphysalis longicornis]